MNTALPLTPPQAALVEGWLPAASLVHDHSWGLTDTRVLQLSSDAGQHIVKTWGPGNRHFQREAAAHRGYTRPLRQTGHAARLLHVDDAARIMVLEYLPGVLVEGSDAEFSPGIHRQAGRVLAVLHAQSSYEDAELPTRMRDSSRRRLDQVHRIGRHRVRAARAILHSAPTAAVRVVPTHGDWQPRNWLLDAGQLRVIDFGRFDFRPAASDLVRLAAQQWRARPELAVAFAQGYGTDLRQTVQWNLLQLHEAIGTAVWGYQIGDEAFEAQGHRMLDDALALF